MTAADRRKAITIIEENGATEEEPGRGARLASGLEALLESDPLVASIDRLGDSVQALRDQISKDNSGVRTELLSELRSQRWQNAVLQIITLGIVAALVGIGMSYQVGGLGIDITPAGGAIRAPFMGEMGSDADADVDRGNDDAAAVEDTYGPYDVPTPSPELP